MLKILVGPVEEEFSIQKELVVREPDFFKAACNEQ
jgi:hypothetical protein